MDFTSNIEEIDTVTRKVSITIPDKSIVEEVEKSIDELSRKGNFKGFRPGKTPRELVKKMHGAHARVDAVDKLWRSALEDVIKTNSFSVVGRPQVDLKEDDKDIQVIATFSIFPNPEIKKYEKFEVKVQKKEVVESDIDDIIHRIIKSKASLKKNEFRDTVQMGDVIDSTATVFVEGAEKPRPEPLVVKLGDNQIPATLEEKLVGIKVGETREIEMPIDEDHADATIRGKAVHYHITLNGIYDEVLPELDDDFVKSLDMPEKTVLELRIGVRSRLEKEHEKQADENVRVEIVKKLVEDHDFQVPQTLIDDEIRNIVVRYGLVKGPIKELSDIDIETFRAKYEAEAIERVKAAIIIDKIAEAEKLHAGKEDIESHFENLSQEYGITKDEVKKFFQKEGRIMDLFLDKTRSKVLDFLAAKAKVSHFKD